MTAELLDQASSAAFEQLLEFYYEAFAANIAYNELFGPNPGDTAEIEVLLPSIRASLEAKKVTPLISTVQEARAAIDTSNFKVAQTTWRKFGTITLIDPDILPSSDVDIPFWAGQSIKDLFTGAAENKTNLFFNTRIPQPNPSEAETTRLMNIQTIPATSQPMGLRPSTFPGTGFASEAMIRYVANIGYVRRKRADNSATTFFDFAEKLLALLERIVNANLPDDGRGGLMTESFGRPYRDWIALQETSLESLSAARALVGSMGPNSDPLMSPLWTKEIMYTSIDPRSQQAGIGSFGENEQDRGLVTVLESELGSIEGEFDKLIEDIAAAVLGTTRVEALTAKHVKAKKQLYIDFLNGVKTESGDADTRTREAVTALKSEKVKEAVLKADRNIKPFDLQCHLMQNIVKLAHQRQGDPRFQPRYRHINPVTTGGRPAEVLNTIQHGNQTPEIKEFINICPDVYGLLEPYIQIWRQEFNDDGTIKMKNNRPVEKQLHIENFLNPADLITLPTGRTPGAGIKSFSWSLKGVQPAEVDNNISANLVMYFQTIDDFFNGASQAGKDEPNFLDLIINSPAVRKLQEGKTAAGENNTKLTKCNFIQDNLHQQYKGTNYRIRVNAGWSVPPNLMPDIEISAPLRRAIEQTQVSLYLQQVRHNLDFKQNGSLELSIEYVASIAGLLTSKSADIFAPTSSPQIDARIAALDERLEAIKSEEQANPNKVTDNDRELKKELLEQKRQSRQEDKLIKYRKLLCGLFQEQNSRIYNLTVNALDLLRPPMRDLDERQRAARAKRFKKEPVAVYLADEVNFSLLSSVDATLAGNGRTQEEGENPPGTAQVARVFSEVEQARFEDIKKDPGSFRFIPFFYLGDLIDSVLQQIANNNGAQQLSFKMFLSETEMIDPNMALQIGDLENVIKCGEGSDLDWLVRLVESDPQGFPGIAGLSTIMNIGDIPISLDAFQVWFKDNVIKKDRESYFFLHFIKDICADLITKAMGSQCFGSNINFSQRFDAQPLQLEKANSIKAGRAVSSTTLGNLHKRVLPTLDTDKSIGGFILVSTDSRPSELKGDFHADLGRGIYHHFIGASCGLLKTMTFNREDQEYLREAKIQKFGALGAEQLRELYSARLELVGNNLYKNGMYIYINPTLIGATKDELDFLGLHGYYLVTGVESKVTPAGFTTNITALHEGIRFDKSRLPSISVQQGIIAEAPPPNANPFVPPPPSPPLLESLGLTESDMGALAARRAGLLDAEDTFQPQFPGDTRAAQEARQNINVPERP